MPLRPCVIVSALLRFFAVSTLLSVIASCQTAAPATPPTNSAEASSPAAAVGVYVYPKNNQDRAQQTKDETECYLRAKQDTGIDPASPPPAASPDEKKGPKGGAVKGAAGGAAAGSAIGAIAGDAGQGAAIGATAGAIRGRRAQKKAQKQAEKQAKANAQAAQKERLDTFRKAFSACMDARQYSVR
jgi:hypothetical protein